jgi:hypothetical protein
VTRDFCIYQRIIVFVLDEKRNAIPSKVAQESQSSGVVGGFDGHRAEEEREFLAIAQSGRRRRM